MAIINNYRDYLQTAKKDIMNADHMLSVTFKVVPDPKLMISVLQKLEKGIKMAMIAMLYYEKKTTIRDLDLKSSDSVLRLFKERCFKPNKIRAKYIEMAFEISDIMTRHKESPFEFRKDGKFIIMEEGSPQMKVITLENVKSYVEDSKMFLFDVMRIMRD